MLDYTQLKRHHNTLAFTDVQLHATNKQNNSSLPREHWTCPGMPDQTQQ